MTVYTQTVNIGSSFEQTFSYTLNGDPVNLTGWGAVFRLRDEVDHVISTVRYGDTGDRSLTIDATHGLIDVTMVASATSGFTAKVGTFELEIYDLNNTGRVFRIIDGAVRYRPKGRAMLDNTVCVIRATTNQVVVETQAISQYQRIDRGPPGASGSTGPAGPIIPVSNTILGAVPALDRGANAFPVSRSDGAAVVHHKGPVYMASYRHLGNDQAAFDAAITEARSIGTWVLCENRTYTGLSYLNLESASGIGIIGVGGGNYSLGGTTLRFDSAPTPTTGSSTSTVTVGTGTKTFVFQTGLHLPNGSRIVVSASGKSVTGLVASYNSGTGSTDIDVSSFTGTGSASSWTMTAVSRPMIDLRSGSYGCTLRNLNVVMNVSGWNGDVIASGHGTTSSDSAYLYLRHVKVASTSGTRLHTAFQHNNTIGLVADCCTADSCYDGFVCGNGPTHLRACGALNWAHRTIISNSAECVLDSCVFEPGLALDGVTETIDGFESTGAFTVLIQGCIFNDAHVFSTGYWIRCTRVDSLVLVGNTIQSDAAQAAVYLDGVGTATALGGDWLCAKMFEIAPAPSSSSGYPTIISPSYLFTNPVTGTNYSRQGVLLGLPNVPDTFGQTTHSFGTFTNGIRMTLGSIALSTGGNNAVSLINGDNYVIGPAGPFSIGGIAYGGAGAGQRIRIWNTTAFPMTIEHEQTGAAATYRIYTPTAANVVLPAATTNGLTFADFERDDAGRWRLIQTCPALDMEAMCPEVDLGNSGTAKTITLASSYLFKLTMTGNCTLTLTDPGDNREVYVRCIQDATGGRTITPPAGCTRPGGALALTAAAGAEDVIAIKRIAVNTYRMRLVGSNFS